MAKQEFLLTVTVSVDADSVDDAKQKFWLSNGMSHYIDGEDVIVDVVELD